MSARASFSLFGAVIVAAYLAAPAEAQWQQGGIQLSPGFQVSWAPTMVPDGAGGAIVAWTDGRSSTTRIYAQHLDSAGVPQWAAGGVPLSTTVGNQGSPAAVDDGAGGAIVAWSDIRAGNLDIYVQHIDASGNALWGSGGLAICQAANDQGSPVIVSDLKSSVPAPGAIIAWQDSRSGVSNIYAQSVDGQTGTVRWAANGVAVAPSAASQTQAVMCTDGTGLSTNPKGAIIAWTDSRNQTSSGLDIYAQRMSGGGAPQWGSSGLAVCTAPGAQQLPSMVFAGSGNAIVAWEDTRTGASDIYAQQVGGGVNRWTGGGVSVCGSTGDQVSVFLTADGAGGAIAAWEDGRYSTTYHDIFAQRVDGSGSALWLANGVPVCTASDKQLVPAVTSDQANGALIVWDDWRSRVGDLYGQRIDSSGSALGNPDGVHLGREAVQDQPQIISDNAQGAIIAWATIDGIYGFIYANRLFAAVGQVGVATGPQAHFDFSPPSRIRRVPRPRWRSISPPRRG
jgi:hypothetical protein